MSSHNHDQMSLDEINQRIARIMFEVSCYAIKKELSDIIAEYEMRTNGCPFSKWPATSAIYRVTELRDHIEGVEQELKGVEKSIKQLNRSFSEPRGKQRS